MESIKRKFLKLCSIEGKGFTEIEKELGYSRKQVQELYALLAGERERISKVKGLYNRKKYIDVSFAEFYEWYESLGKACCYCEITQEQIDQLFERKLIGTKRQVTRGKSLELERVVPDISYEDLNNLRFACYWCNNAKSDEFNEAEFRPIAKEIGKALRARLSR